MSLCVISVGTSVRVMVARLRSGTGSALRTPVIGMSSIDSIEVMSVSGYWTPTKYWLWVLGSIQKFRLLKVIDEFRAATTFLHHVLLGHPQVRRLGPVDVDDELGIILPLDDPGVDHAVDLLDAGLDHRGDLRGLGQVLAGDADVQRRRLAFIQGAPDQAAGVEGEFQVLEPGSLATTARILEEYSWADASRCSASWMWTIASIGPALGV